MIQFGEVPPCKLVQIVSFIHFFRSLDRSSCVARANGKVLNVKYVSFESLLDVFKYNHGPPSKSVGG